MRNPFAVFTAIVALVGLSTSVQAAVVTGNVTTPSPSGVFTELDPAPSAVGDDDQNVNDTLFAFDEQQGVVLGADLTLHQVPGGGINPIPAGTRVNSHYVFIDPVNTQTIIGTVTFDEEVLGVLSTDTRLDGTNTSLGLAGSGTTYSTGSLLGLESGDVVSFPGVNQVGIDFTAGSPGDYVRVITASSIPLPAAAWAGGALIAGFALRRYRCA